MNSNGEIRFQGVPAGCRGQFQVKLGECVLHNALHPLGDMGSEAEHLAVPLSFSCVEGEGALDGFSSRSYRFLLSNLDVNVLATALAFKATNCPVSPPPSPPRPENYTSR